MRKQAHYSYKHPRAYNVVQVQVWLIVSMVPANSFYGRYVRTFNTNVTGFAKTIPNGTRIEIQFIA